jgi:hypothetical protein
VNLLLCRKYEVAVRLSHASIGVGRGRLEVHTEGNATGSRNVYSSMLDDISAHYSMSGLSSVSLPGESMQQSESFEQGVFLVFTFLLTQSVPSNVHSHCVQSQSVCIPTAMELLIQCHYQSLHYINMHYGY